MNTILLATTTLLLSLILVSLWLVLYQVVKQQGRLLLRLDDVDRRLPQGGMPSPMPQIAGRHEQPRGLVVGTLVPNFRLRDLDERETTLDRFRGSRVLLVHWSPQCGFCTQIASELAQLQAQLAASNVQLVFVSHGDPASNRNLAEEYGLECPILLLDEGGVVDAFQGLGTPVAYLLGEDGRVTEALAVGAEQVPALARKVAVKEKAQKRPAGEQAARPVGLKAGTPAPSFLLPDTYGRIISWDEYRDRHVLLVLSSPQCGACDQLAPHLMRHHSQLRDHKIEILMVVRGDPMANRQKAEEFEFDFPVVLQASSEVADAFEVWATPAGFLIDSDGKIECSAALGVERIWALIEEILAGEAIRRGETEAKPVEPLVLATGNLT